MHLNNFTTTFVLVCGFSLLESDGLFERNLTCVDINMTKQIFQFSRTDLKLRKSLQVYGV